MQSVGSEPTPVVPALQNLAGPGGAGVGSLATQRWAEAVERSLELEATMGACGFPCGPQPLLVAAAQPLLTSSSVSPTRGPPHPRLPLFYGSSCGSCSTVPFKTLLASHDLSAFSHFLCLNLFCTPFKSSSAGPSTSFHSTPLLSYGAGCPCAKGLPLTQLITWVLGKGGPLWHI